MAEVEQVGDRQVNRDLEWAGSVLAGVLAEVRISERRLRQAESILLVREHRDRSTQQLGFASRPFVLCGLPVRHPPRSTLLYERRNGQFTRQITGHPISVCPFGQDRLLPIFLATLAVRQQRQTIRFRSASEMLDTFGLAKGGKECRRLIAAFERIFGATNSFGTDSTRHYARVIQRSRFNFFREAQIWYNRRSSQLAISLYSTCSCGSAPAASPQRGKSAFRCSENLA